MKIAAYVEAARLSPRAALDVLRFPEIWPELAIYLWALRRGRVPA